MVNYGRNPKRPIRCVRSTADPNTPHAPPSGSTPSALIARHLLPQLDHPVSLACSSPITALFLVRGSALINYPLVFFFFLLSLRQLVIT